MTKPVAADDDDMMLIPVWQYEELWNQVKIYRDALIEVSQSSSREQARAAAAALGRRSWG